MLRKNGLIKRSFWFLFLVYSSLTSSCSYVTCIDPSSIGAFTRTCSGLHLPNYIDNLPALKEKGVDLVAVISFNDANVMSGWGKANNVTNNDIVWLMRQWANNTPLTQLTSDIPL